MLYSFFLENLFHDFFGSYNGYFQGSMGIHGTHRRNKPHGRHIKSRLVNSRYFKKKVQNTRTRDFERNKIFLSNPVSKFPCLSSLLTPGSLSFPRIPTRIPTLASLIKRYSKITETV